MELLCERILNPPQDRSTKRDLLCSNILATCMRVPEFRDLSCEKQFDIMNAIERGVLNRTTDHADADGVLCSFKTPEFVSRYSVHGYRVLKYLEQWLPRILSNAIDADKFSYLTSEELDPDANRAERDEIQKRRDQKIEIKTSKQYRCRKCGHNEMIPMQYQARALDEGGSLSLRCIKCNHVQR